MVAGKQIPVAASGGQVQHAGEYPIVAVGGTYPDPTASGVNYVAGSYVLSDGLQNPPSGWAKGDNVSISASSGEQVDGFGADVYTLRFTGGPTPNKVLVLADSASLNILSGGVLQASNSGVTVIANAPGSSDPQGITSSGGQLYHPAQQQCARAEGAGHRL